MCFPLGKPKGRPLRKKELFWNFFKILLRFKNKNYFTLNDLSKYGHITLNFVVKYFIWVVSIFSKYFAQPLRAELFFCGFPYIDVQPWMSKDSCGGVVCGDVPVKLLSVSKSTYISVGLGTKGIFKQYTEMSDNASKKYISLYRPSKIS